MFRIMFYKRPTQQLESSLIVIRQLMRQWSSLNRRRPLVTVRASTMEIEFLAIVLMLGSGDMQKHQRFLAGV
jgi:hypothetical protein